MAAWQHRLNIQLPTFVPFAIGDSPPQILVFDRREDIDSLWFYQASGLDHTEPPVLSDYNGWTIWKSTWINFNIQVCTVL